MGARMGWIDVVLVETIGRKTGKKRTVPIACYPYKDSVVVSASNSGSDKNPAWYLNMMAHPDVAGALIGTLPTLLVFIFLQRYFIEGLTLGSTK